MEMCTKSRKLERWKTRGIEWYSYAKLSLYRNNPNHRNPNIVYLQVNKDPWSLPKEDFLHFIATGQSKGGLKHERGVLTTSPSLTQQEPWVNAIVEMLGGWNIPEIKVVREVQKHGVMPHPFV